MSEIKITGNRVGEALAFESRRASTSLRDASLAAARRMVPYLANQADSRKITDRGIYKAGFKARRRPNGAENVNDAPHAGIIELGARPHKVSAAGIKAIARWAVRKLGLKREEAQSAAWGIAKKLEAEGQEPQYVVRDSLPQARAYFDQEFKRFMSNRKRLS